jgi:hypothetical protein
MSPPKTNSDGKTPYYIQRPPKPTSKVQNSSRNRNASVNNILGVPRPRSSLSESIKKRIVENKQALMRLGTGSKVAPSRIPPNASVFKINNAQVSENPTAQQFGRPISSRSAHTTSRNPPTKKPSPPRSGGKSKSK